MKNPAGDVSTRDGLNLRHQLLTLGNKLETFADNPERLERHRARFDKDAGFLSDDSGDTVLEDADIRHLLGQPSNIDRRWNAMIAWKNSTPCEQFERHVTKVWLETKLPLCDRNKSKEIAEITVREDWKAQGIWNQKWGKKPEKKIHERWMHEEAPDSASTSEADTAPASNTNITSGLKSAELQSSLSHWGIKLPKAVKPSTEQKHDHDASRPFQQFIHQLSKERERLLLYESTSGPIITFDNADINNIAYENVKNDWKASWIWNEKWGTIPGMKWKHEEPFEMPKDDPTPEPENLTNDVAGECFPGLVGLDRNSVPADAECILPTDLRRLSSVDEDCTIDTETERILPANAEPNAPKRGQGTRKRKSTTDDIEQRAPKRRISRKPRSNIPDELAEDTRNASLMAVHGQENQNSHIRRSKRLTNRASSSK